MRGGKNTVYTVKQARLLAGKTQVEMAEMLGVSRDTYRKIEQYPDRATVKQAQMICEITGIPAEKILFLDRE